MAAHALWVEKYRPKTLDDYIFHNKDHEQAFRNMVQNQSIPHLLLHGTQGSGKTAIAQILINSLNVIDHDFDVSVINASDENSVEVMREKIKNFASTAPFGQFKIMLLEEADHISQPGQAILRRLMEEYHDNVRFILTCNYEHRLIPAIKSRCQDFSFKAPLVDDITEMCAIILSSENIDFSLEVLDQHIAQNYPDVRKIINQLQRYSTSGVCQSPTTASSTTDWQLSLLDLLKQNKWNDARLLVCSSVTGDEWEALFRFMYENLHYIPKFKDKSAWDEGIIIIADHLYKASIVADGEINAAAMFIKLQQIQ